MDTTRVRPAPDRLVVERPLASDQESRIIVIDVREARRRARMVANPSEAIYGT
jgi:hypothetical protein